MTTDWKPKQRAGLQWDRLQLSPEEGFLLSRVDGATSVEGLRHLTGLSDAQVAVMLAKLQATGAIDRPPPSALDAAATTLHPAPELTYEETIPRGARVNELVDADDDGDDEALIQAALQELRLDASILDGDETDEGAAVVDEDVAEVIMHTTPPASRGADAADSGTLDDDDGAAVEDDPDAASADAAEAKAAVDADAAADAVADAEDAEGAVEEGNYRKLFETQLHDLPLEEREQLARTASGATLMALGFDPVPQVIIGMMQNTDVGFPHARLIARYHRTAQGLDALFKRSEMVRDMQVQRYLLTNPMLNDSQFKRVLQPKPLMQVYKWSLSRDLPEKNRQKVRQLLRSKWSVADGEERANLVWSTEGRCLQYLAGLALDSKATTLLCQRSIHSVMMIQSLTRFTATPPPLLAHLARQPVVKRQPNLRTMIQQHPNCPSEMKRKLRGG